MAMTKKDFITYADTLRGVTDPSVIASAGSVLQDPKSPLRRTEI